MRARAEGGGGGILMYRMQYVAATPLTTRHRDHGAFPQDQSNVPNRSFVPSYFVKAGSKTLSLAYLPQVAERWRPL